MDIVPSGQEASLQQRHRSERKRTLKHIAGFEKDVIKSEMKKAAPVKTLKSPMPAIAVVEDEAATPLSRGGASSSCASTGRGRSPGPVPRQHLVAGTDDYSHRPGPMRIEFMTSVPASMLDAQNRDEEKKRQKRAANRKSAYTSRARKKQFVQDMTVANRDLKQHAHILDLLPDLIIVVDRHERISYVSKSVTLKLRYSSDSLVGSPVSDLLTPQTRHVITTALHRKGFNRGNAAQSCHPVRPSGRHGNGSRSSGDDGSTEGSDESLYHKAAAQLKPKGSSSVCSSAPGGAPAAAFGTLGLEDRRRGAVAVSVSSSSMSQCWGGLAAVEPWAGPSGWTGQAADGVGVPEAGSVAAAVNDHVEAARLPPRLGEFSSASLASAEPSLAGTTATTSSGKGRGSGGSSSSSSSTTTGGGSTTSGTGSSNTTSARANASGNSSDGDTESQGQGSSGEAEDLTGSDGDRTYAKWSHVNLQRHNQEIDQLSDQAVWKVCMIRSDRTTLWCEMSVNTNEQAGAAAEVILSLRPVRDGSPVPEDYVILSDNNKKKSSSGGVISGGGGRRAPKGAASSCYSSEGSTTSSLSGSSSVGASASSSKRSSRRSKGQQKVPHEKTPRESDHPVASAEHKIASADLTVAETLLGLMGK